MGNYFEKQQIGQNYDKQCIHFIRTKKDMEDVHEVVEYIRNYFPTSYKFNLEEFTEIFEQYFEQHTEFIFMRLQNDQNRNGYVDVFETIALMCLVNNDDFERRVDYIFRLFDFDFSNNLDMDEFILTIQTVMKGLCKIVDLNPPSLQDMEHFADRFFSSADENQDGSISMNEFVQFVKQNWELQDWFLKFADIQTYENALRRHQDKELFLIQQFLGFKNIKENDVFVKIKSNTEVFFPILRRQLKDMSQQDFELLTKYLILVSKTLYKEQEEGFINYAGFKSVINAWSAFDGCDINYDNYIDKNEIEFLIASMENYKPTKERIQAELKNIDADNNGNISREEWIKYICLDKFSSAKSFLRINLRYQFMKESKSENHVQKNQVKNIINATIVEFLQRFKYKEGDILDKNTENETINKIQNQIYARCREEYIKEQFVISWEGLKNNLELSILYDHEFQEFINKYK